MARLNSFSPGPAREKTAEMTRVGIRVSLVSIVGNAILSLFKALAGILAHSGAMISDAVHSASDVFSSIIVIIGMKLTAKKADRDHPYGHERFECIAELLLAAVLLITDIFIAQEAIETLIHSDAENFTAPGVLALVAAIVSIVGKEAMYWYTRHYAKALDSGALMADAWHHRSDALSSVGALVGIAGAMMGFSLADTIASLVICVFIFKATYDIFRDAVGKLVDHAAPPETEAAIAACAAKQQGVLRVDLVNTRVFGSRIYVDIEFSADAAMPLAEAHEIAQRVHDAVEQQFEKVKHIMVHVNPYLPAPSDGEETDKNRSDG